MNTYYFGIGEEEIVNEFTEDENEYLLSLVNSAEFIFVLATEIKLTRKKFEDMIENSKNNILNGNSKVFDYPDDFDINERFDNIFLIDEDDIIYEMTDIYNVEIMRSEIPLIWGADCWQNDDNYDEYNTPELWRLCI